MSGDIKGIKSIGTTVPQIFYDLFARIMPGITLIIFGYVVFNEQGLSQDQITKTLNLIYNKDSSAFLVLLTIIFLAYMVSLLMNALGEAVGLKLYYNNPKLLTTLTKEFFPTIKKINPALKSEDEVPNVFLMFYFIRMIDPSMCNRIIKTMSQVHMFNTLRTGFLFLTIIRVYINLSLAISSSSFIAYVSSFSLNPLPPNSRIPWLEIILITCTMISWVKSKLLFKTLISEVYYSWFLLKGDEHLEEITKKYNKTIKKKKEKKEKKR